MQAWDFAVCCAAFTGLCAAATAAVRGPALAGAAPSASAPPVARATATTVRRHDIACLMRHLHLSGLAAPLQHPSRKHPESKLEWPAGHPCAQCFDLTALLRCVIVRAENLVHVMRPGDIR